MRGGRREVGVSIVTILSSINCINRMSMRGKSIRSTD